MNSNWVRAALLLPAILAFGFAWTICTAREQESNDARLIAAIRSNDPEAVRLCIARGANPDPGEVLKTNRTLWAHILAFVLRGKVPGKSAMLISEQKIILASRLTNPSHPLPHAEWRDMISIYEMLVQAQCRKNPRACGPR